MITTHPKAKLSFYKYVIYILIIFSIISIGTYLQYTSESKLNILSNFQNDFIKQNIDNSITNQELYRKKMFLAFAKYKKLIPGNYEFTFLLTSKQKQSGIYEFQLASEKGRNILYRKKININQFPDNTKFVFTLNTHLEIEPRLLYIKGNSQIKLHKVQILRKKILFPWLSILFNSIIISFMFFYIFYIFQNAYYKKNTWQFALNLFLLTISFIIIIQNTWLTEDALITLRHVDNFLKGNGPVFNAGVRVEGFTHVLWFYIAVVFRWLGFSAKGSVILPGLISSFIFLFLLFFVINFNKKEKHNNINFSGAILIGMSAFIDFATSGLETSMSYLLLGIYALFISKNFIKEKPFHMGTITSLLVLNRPDFGVYLIIISIIYLYYLIKKHITFSIFIKFFSIPAIILVSYEIFRMLYYTSLFPNPFYAKSGSNAYFSQGISYLIDFCLGSSFLLIFLIASIAIFITYKKKENGWKNRSIIYISAIIYGFFIIRGGGDFMHGRFLLPTTVLLVICSKGAFNFLHEHSKIKNIIAISFVFLLFIGSLFIIPRQKKNNIPQINGISDERHIYYKNKKSPLKNLFIDDQIFMWKTIGNNYNYLNKKTKLKISISYHTIGYIGYYAGINVNVIDRLGLTDPIVARQINLKRRRPGHEKSAPFGYLMMNDLTFGDTPFPLWNKIAKTKYGVLWNLSNRYIGAFSFFLEKNFKKNIDDSIIIYLKNLSEENIKQNSDFLFFLKSFWYKYTVNSNKKLFDQYYNEKVINQYSSNYKWIKNNNIKIKQFFSGIKGPFRIKNSFNNFISALHNHFVYFK